MAEITAFVLGGGGVLGAHEVGMLAALAEAGIRPDLVIGTSIGAINGVFVAADPDGAAQRLAEVWRSDVVRHAFRGNVFARINTLARSGTHLHGNAPLARLLEEHLPVATFEELTIPFQCVAANVERASAHWFTSGLLAPAILASAAVPGLLPPVVIDGEHYFDGGLVHSIPVGRAVALGARTIYVLQVGRIERPLAAPRWPWEVGLVAFEIARRHRFVEEMATLPPDVTAHVLPATRPGRPSGSGHTATRVDLSQLRYRDTSRIDRHIARAHAATAAYLAGCLDRESADAEPADAEPADAEPADAEPADAEPADAEPADAEPADAAEPDAAEPDAAEPDADPS
jgi:NTE family protein